MLQVLLLVLVGLVLVLILVLEGSVLVLVLVLVGSVLVNFTELYAIVYMLLVSFSYTTSR